MKKIIIAIFTLVFIGCSDHTSTAMAPSFDVIDQDNNEYIVTDDNQSTVTDTVADKPVETQKQIAPPKDTTIYRYVDGYDNNVLEYEISGVIYNGKFYDTEWVHKDFTYGETIFDLAVECFDGHMVTYDDIAAMDEYVDDILGGRTITTKYIMGGKWTAYNTTDGQINCTNTSCQYNYMCVYDIY